MILYFPDLDTLRLALTSGAVPTSVSLAPAVAAVEDAGPLWLQPAVAVPRAAQAELRRLGVQMVKENGALLAEEVSCWPQLLPVRRAELPALTPQTPVLFELSNTKQLPELVGEMLRLGNDRQGFRWLEDGTDTRVLLRVVGPPYYTLLRALEREGREAAPRAYLERAPRVWVEVGHDHPLLQQVQPPAGQVLLLRPPRTWTALADAPFRDIYDILEFKLPAAAVSWQDVEAAQKLTVPLRLARGGGTEAAQLWVVHDRPLAQIDALVHEHDDRLLARLSFAVVRKEGDIERAAVVLKVRPSKQAPPVLSLDAVSFRPFLKLPNLFLPCGSRLQPPLRRDAVRKLLADDPARVTWLFPQPDGHFTPESLPDEAFRPLEDWVDYVLDHDHQALEAWVQAARFDFESFVCNEDQPARPKKPKEKSPRGPRGPASGDDLEEAPPPAANLVVKKARRKAEADDVVELPVARPSELQQRLQDLEKKFFELQAPLDAPERQDMWRELALLYTAAGSSSDASVCWVNSLWEDDEPAPRWLRAWQDAEERGRHDGAPAGADRLTGQALDQILAESAPSLADLRTLAAAVVRAGHQEPPDDTLRPRLDRIHRFLEKHEAQLSVRAAWLAWVSLVKLSHGDVLALARARDRLLERLFQGGLSSDLDLPGFLRFSGQKAGERFRAVRNRVLRLRDLAQYWITSENVPTARTDVYVDLTFSYGLARLGETAEAQKLLEKAIDQLGHEDVVHKRLLEAYEHRIRQALDGKPNAGPLPRELLDFLEQRMERLDRYKIEALRKKSRILEPHERLDPYRHFTARTQDDLGQQLAGLSDVLDHGELSHRLGQLLARPPKGAGKDGAVRVLEKALQLAPRLGETFARDVLARTAALPVQATANHELAVSVLEKALFLAAHYDQPEAVQTFVERFRQLLGAFQGTPAVQELDTLVAQCFRGLRKLGMRDQIDVLLREMAQLVLQGEELAALGERLHAAASQKKSITEWTWKLRTLLHLAAGWFYFGKDVEARAVLDAVRDILFTNELMPVDQTKLARAYATTLGQASVEFALKRIEELFQKLEGVHDTFTTTTHFSASRLELVEAVVLAVVSDDFALGGEVRRWLEDDEYLVRRRIHHDLRALMAQAGV